MKRSEAGALGVDDVGRKVKLQGWVHRRRDHGGVIFLNLRDRSGIVQVVVHPEDAAEAAANLSPARNEWVVEVVGAVAARAPEAVNPEHEHRRDRGRRGGGLRSVLLGAAALQRRGRRRRDGGDPPALPLSRPAPGRAAAQPDPAASSDLRHPAVLSRRGTSSTSRRRSSRAPRPRGRATTSCPVGFTEGPSTRCRSRPRSSSRSAWSRASSATCRLPAASATRIFEPTGSRSSPRWTSRCRSLRRRTSSS